jgi:hypothetical protein
MSSTDVATREAGAQLMPKPTEKLVKAVYGAILDGTPVPEVGDPEITNRAILEEIMAADTFEKVFQAQTLPSWQDFALDSPVTVHSFHMNRSTFEGGSSAYAVVEIAYPDSAGEERRQLVTVGGQKVLVQLVKAWEQEWFPIKVKLSSKETRTEGRKVLGLEPVSA